MSLKLAPLLRTLTIQDKETAALIRLNLSDEFAWAQRAFCQDVERQYNAGKPVRSIVLKARQLGLSTISEAVLFWWVFLHQGIDGLVLSHELDASMDLIEKARLFWELWPYNKLFTTKSLTQKRLKWEETKSTLQVASAKNIRSGRGRTIHALHASECAYYQDAETLMGGLYQTIPNVHGTLIVLESTANGVGNWFHEQWQAAEAGESDFSPLFFPWWQHYAYEVPTTLVSDLELNPEERELRRVGATFPNLQWRRWALRNLCHNDEQFFCQEYPATPLEAFLTTGLNVFPTKKLDECFLPIRGHRGMLAGDPHGNNPKFIPDPGGPLTIFKGPTKNSTPRSDRYFVAGDPSMTLSGDPACIQVINRGTMEQIAVWHGRIDPINFAREMMLLGRYYHDAELCPEVEGGGQATIATIMNSGYPNIWQHRWADHSPGKVGTTYGWATNFQRKSWAISQLKYLIADNSVVVHDKKTYSQLRDYTVLPDGSMGTPNARQHDDAVMALAICVTASITEGPYAEQQQRSNVFDLFTGQNDA